MERKIGEIFERNGEWYQCVKSDGTCNGCAGEFRSNSFCYGFKDCVGKIFKKLEKVGEPYMAHDHSRNKDVVVQDYKLYNQHACYTGHEEMLSFGLCGKVGMVTIKSKEPIKSLNCENSVEIEIKQTKEDIEEKNNAKHSNSEKIGKNLKEFDLQKAREGKPVCTRDGRKARIICFDLNNDEYPIVAVITNNGKENELYKYDINGINGTIGNLDLMMLPEKK